MSKTRLDISIDQDLADFIAMYVQENRTTIPDIIAQLILALKQQAQEGATEIISSNPAFQKALIDMQHRLRNGTAEWHGFEEVFGE
ncbi:MAG: hypothetical protein GY862_09460 [Gammaproteobacteria bacterium]|nr:hypothetical protein [Gammaproteobacteria bacterium]